MKRHSVALVLTCMIFLVGCAQVMYPSRVFIVQSNVEHLRKIKVANLGGIILNPETGIFSWEATKYLENIPTDILQGLDNNFSRFLDAEYSQKKPDHNIIPFQMALDSLNLDQNKAIANTALLNIFQLGLKLRKGETGGPTPNFDYFFLDFGNIRKEDVATLYQILNCDAIMITIGACKLTSFTSMGLISSTTYTLWGHATCQIIGKDGYQISKHVVKQMSIGGRSMSVFGLQDTREYRKSILKLNQNILVKHLAEKVVSGYGEGLVVDSLLGIQYVPFVLSKSNGKKFQINCYTENNIHPTLYVKKQILDNGEVTLNRVEPISYGVFGVINLGGSLRKQIATFKLKGVWNDSIPKDEQRFIFYIDNVDGLSPQYFIKRTNAEYR